MSSEEEVTRKKQAASEARKREEEYNRMKRLELMEKYKRSSYASPFEKDLKTEEKELIEHIRAERLAMKEKSKQSVVSVTGEKYPRYIVRRGPSRIEESDQEERVRRFSAESGKSVGSYYPHQGIRRDLVEDITKGGSRRATEPLKAQLLEIIGGLSPDSKFLEDRKIAALAAGLSPKSPKTHERRGPGGSSQVPGSPRRMSPHPNADSYDEGAGPSRDNRQEGVAPTSVQSSPRHDRNYDSTDESSMPTQNSQMSEDISEKQRKKLEDKNRIEEEKKAKKLKQIEDKEEAKKRKNEEKAKKDAERNQKQGLVTPKDKEREEREEAEAQRRNSDMRRREEEYNRLKRLELIEKYKGTTYPNPYERRSLSKTEEKNFMEQLRAERLANPNRRQSLDSQFGKLQWSVRRKSTSSDASGPASVVKSRRLSGDSAAYYPHEGVRRNVLKDITKGGSRRATEPLKAQLLEVMKNMTPDSKFLEDRRASALRAEFSPKHKSHGTAERSGRDLTQGETSGHQQAPTSSHRAPHRAPPDSQQRETTPYRNVESDAVAGPSAYADASGVSNRPVGGYPDSQVSNSFATNTVKLPSTSSAMRDGRTQEFLNEGWYQNAYYQDTNDGFSSIPGSSARQMNIPPETSTFQQQMQQQYMQNIQSIQNMQHLAATGPIICDRCRYGNELVSHASHSCCPALAQTMLQMDASSQQPARAATAIQCDNVCTTRNSIMRTIFNTFKNPLGRSTQGRPTFDPTVSELYRLNISEGNDYQGHPKRVIFDLIDGGMYRPTMASVGTNTQMGIGHSPLIAQMGIIQPGGSSKLLFNPPPPLPPQPPGQQSTYTDQQGTYNSGAIVINHPPGEQANKSPSKIAALKQNLRRHQERIDVYYFDHGNASYYRTTDSPGTVYTELLAERTEHNTAQYWAELFGTIHIAFSLFTAFFLQLYRFVLQSTYRPLTVGFVQLTSDYLIKPTLALIFNAIIQPILIYLYNIATSFRDLCEPIADALGFFLREIAVPIRAFRLVEVRQHKNTRPYAQML